MNLSPNQEALILIRNKGYKHHWLSFVRVSKKGIVRERKYRITELEFKWFQEKFKEFIEIKEEGDESPSETL